MAVDAGHFSFTHGVVIGKFELNVDFHVAGLATVEGIVASMDVVAVRAGKAFHRMSRGCPFGLILVLVTIDTGLCVFALGEGVDQARIAFLHVGLAISVASDATDVATVDLEAVDPHVDLVFHSGGYLVVALRAHCVVTGKSRNGNDACHGDERQQDTAFHISHLLGFPKKNRTIQKLVSLRCLQEF